MPKEQYQRAAFIIKSECRPNKCRQECKKNCPVNKVGKKCIAVKPDSKIAYISETLCVGCGICVKKCPFGAIRILNLPLDLEAHTVHRYGANSFKLHRLPIPRPGKVLGLVGCNGIGKSTALAILGGLKPNLGLFAAPPDWQHILKHFRGSELQSYFTKILEDDIRTATKPQYVDQLAKKLKGTVARALRRGSRGPEAAERRAKVTRDMQLTHLLERSVSDLSGGELQRLAISMVVLQDADVYIFDEPSSYLDVRQRLQAARVVRELMDRQRAGGNVYAIVVEHDLSVLDYLSDHVCVLYGAPGAYGVVTLPYSVREGINHFLEGFIPTENLRFRDSKMTFRFNEGGMPPSEESVPSVHRYPEMDRTQGGFRLHVRGGSFTESQIVVLLGENGTGKSTFIRLLAGAIPPDDERELPQLSVSYKPQKIETDFEGSVRLLLHKKIRASYTSASFVADIMKPLKIDQIIDRAVQTLSGGELQRVALALCLGKKAQLYLIDEPSAYLDSEQRMSASKAIKKFFGR